MLCACRRHIHIFNLGLHHKAYRSEENSLGSHCNIGIFLWRNTHDCCRIDSISAMRYGGNMEFRIVILQRIKSCMVAKVALQDLLLGSIDIALNHKVAIFGNIDIVCDTLYQLYGFSAQQTCQQVLVNVVRHGCSSGVGIYRVATYRYRHGHLLASCLICLVVACARLVAMPVHSRSAVIEDLHTIHSDIANTAIRVYCMRHRKRYETPTIIHPTFQNWEQ